MAHSRCPINCGYHRVLTVPTVTVPWPRTVVSSLTKGDRVNVFLSTKRRSPSFLPETHLNLNCHCYGLRRQSFRRDVSLGLYLCKWINTNRGRRKWKITEENLWTLHICRGVHTCACVHAHTQTHTHTSSCMCRVSSCGLNMHVEGCKPVHVHTSLCTHSCQPLASTHVQNSPHLHTQLDNNHQGVEGVGLALWKYTLFSLCPSASKCLVEKCSMNQGPDSMWSPQSPLEAQNWKLMSLFITNYLVRGRLQQQHKAH